MSAETPPSREGKVSRCRHLGGHNTAEDTLPPTDDTGKDPDNVSDDGVPSNIPVDKGWAWVICAGCFFITFVMSLYDQVLAVILVDVVEKFNVTVTTAVVVFTIYSFTFATGSVISTNILVPRFGVRVVIVIAAIINSASTIIIAVSPSIVFYLTMHLFKGLAIGSMWIPALGLIGHYFKRRRSLASSFTNTGISVALLAVPPFVRLLLNNFGFMGSLLIISGVEMQAVAVSMLLRPPSGYARPDRKAVSVSQNNQNQSEQYSLLEKVELQCHQSILTQFNSRSDEDNSTYILKAASERDNLQEGTRRTCTEHGINEQVNLRLLTQDEDDESADSTAANYRQIKQDENPSRMAQSCQDCCENSTACDQTNLGTNQASLLTKRIHVAQTDADTGKENQNYVDTKIRRASMDLTNLGEVKKEKDETLFITESRSVSRCFSCAFLKTFFDVDLFSDWMMRIIMASTVFGALLMYIPSYIPTLADDRGVDKFSAAILLTVCGGVSLFSTMLQGLVIDCKLISAAKFVVISMVAVGSMCHLVRFFNSFPTLLLLSISQGMFGGARISLMPIVSMDFVGVKNLSKALGFNAMVATLSLSLHHSFLGFLVQATSGFNATFHYVGFALYASAGLLLLENTGRKLNARRHIRRIPN